MPLKRPAPRGSKYRLKKIDPKKFYVAYEGSDDEKEYFNHIASRISKRFVQNVRFIPVDKSSTDAEPIHVLSDLEKKLLEHGESCNKNDDVEAFIVIDTDHHFTGTHTKETVRVLQECGQKGIQVCLTNPCFEIWMLCHLTDLTELSIQDSQSLLENKKVSKHDTVAKKLWKTVRGETQLPEIGNNIDVALENEQNLNQLVDTTKTPPPGLYSDVGNIFRQLKDCGIEL